MELERARQSPQVSPAESQGAQFAKDLSYMAFLIYGAAIRNPAKVLKT
jgi:hypothetical protein